MEKHDILPQTIYKFYCDEKILEKSSEYIKNLEYVPITHNLSSKDRRLNTHRKLNKLHDWFQSCINEVTNDLNYNDELAITQSWATKSMSGQWHHPHSHPYSIISGVFYLTGSNAETWFSIPSMWDLPDVFGSSIGDDNRVIHKNKTEKGCLVIFPSTLFHSVNEHYDSESRYILSFNTFFNGSMGNIKNAAGAYLKIL